MGRLAGRSIDLEFTTAEDTIYTARAGLIPIMNVAKKIKLPQALDRVCATLRHPSYVDFKASEIIFLLAMSLLSGLYRVNQILASAELPFLAKLVNLARIPAATTIARLFERFDEKAIAAMQAVTFELGLKNIIFIDGYHILVHDQSALQKYGKKMEGVEKGYGGTLKRGALMLQSSLIVDAGMLTVLHLDIRPGSTSSFKGATAEMDNVLSKLPKEETGRRLVLADSAYGAGDYMRMCDKRGAHFILGVKNDSWMKDELAALDFKRFKHGNENPEYGYRDFIADRKVWLGDAAEAPLFDDDWDGSRRVVVVRLPCEKGDPQKFLFISTSLPAEIHSAEDIHILYRKNREAIEQVNDEIQNQLGLAELPSHALDANRAIAQVVALAWNLQRHVEHVAMAKERKDEAIRRAKTNIAESRKTQRRFEWWTMFVRFITVGGRLKTRSNRLAVITSRNKDLMAWVNALEEFNWKAYAL